MPIYEYRCESCGHLLDALQKISDPPLADCPECNKPALKRLISAPSFRLKGGGWYETDFKGDKERKRNLAESGGGAGGEKKDSGDTPKDSGKAETKSDSKSPSTSESSSGGASAEAKKSPSKSKGSGTEAA